MTQLLSILKKKNLLKDLYLIRKSYLWDKSWYLQNNPDIIQAKMNPAFHYLLFGGFEERDPSPYFSSSWYMKTYEDVSAAKINPLIHYLRYGRKENRLPLQLNDSSVRRVKKVPSLPSPTSSSQKVFCIGYNKTGTTSIGCALESLGYNLGDQAAAEQLMDNWAVRNFQSIIEYCSKADAFQDLPFSIDFTYQILDFVFPDSKFILTVRDNADEWYESLIRFYQKIMGIEHFPTAKDMKKFPYGGEGWFWRQEKNIFHINETTVCNKEIYKASYTGHNKRVIEYFRFRPNDLLILNLSNPSSIRLLCEFLGKKYVGQRMPHLNKSEE